MKKSSPPFPGIRVTANGNQLVSYHTETRIADAGIFYPITPSTEGGELYQQAFAEGKLNVFGGNTIAVEAAMARCPRIQALSVAPLLGEAIQRIHDGASVSSLFV